MSEFAELLFVKQFRIEAVVDGEQVDITVHVERLQVLDLLQEFRLISYIRENVVHVFVVAHIRVLRPVDGEVRPIGLWSNVNVLLYWLFGL